MPWLTMDNAVLSKLKDALAQNENLGIVVGRNPKIDEMGAALAFYLALKTSGKSITITCPTDPIVEISSLVGIDEVKKNLDSEGGDLTVSFPYQEGEIEKVSYTLEDGFLNIIVKAGENGLSFNEKEILYKRSGALPTLLFVIGTPRISDLGNLFNPEVLKNTTIVNIDNKSDNQGFGDIVLVSSKFSSVSEMITDIINFLDLELDIDSSQNLLSGIAFATNNFQNQKTSSLAFEMAALLMKKGAIRTEPIKNKYFEEEDDFSVSSFKPIQNIQNQKTKPLDFTSFTNKQQFPKKQMPFPRKPQQPFQQQQQQRKPQPQQHQQPQPKKDDNQEAPSDWLTPKIYKGSSSIE